MMGEISQVIENGRLAEESGVTREPRGFSRLA
jgi:hypothetical protein